MKRAITQALLQWKGSTFRKPLVVRGARQVGKTYSISEFGRQEFPHFLSFKLELERSVRQVFQGDLKPAVLLPQLEALSGKRIVPGETLLFFDEIQACPPAMQSM